MKPCVVSDGDFYEVERILSHRKTGNSFEYLAKWQGFPEAEATWVREEDFASADFVRDYWRDKLKCDEDAAGFEGGRVAQSQCNYVED